MIDSIDELPDLEDRVIEKKKPTFEGHRDYQREIMNIIEELEKEGTVTFRLDEVFEKAKVLKISEAKVREEINGLVERGYIHKRQGTDNLYEKTGSQDFSPAFEDTPEW